LHHKEQAVPIKTHRNNLSPALETGEKRYYGRASPVKPLFGAAPPIGGFLHWTGVFRFNIPFETRKVNHKHNAKRQETPELHFPLPADGMYFETKGNIQPTVNPLHRRPLVK
jgi:hypothetical protein